MVTGGLRGLAGFIPSWTSSCGDNPSINDILDQIDECSMAKIAITIGTGGSAEDGTCYDYNCDGVDDDVEFQAAEEEAKILRDSGVNAHIIVTGGIYRPSNEITVYDDIPVHGFGFPIIDGTNMVSSGLKYIFLSTDDLNKNQFEFEGIGFMGFITHGVVPTEWGVFPAVGGILVNNCQLLRVKKCYFIDCWNAATPGIDRDTKQATQGPLNVQNVEYEDNYVFECLGGLQGYGMRNVIWDSNHFEKVADDSCAFLTTNAGTAPRADRAVCTNNIMIEGTYLNDNGVRGRGVLLKLDGGGVADVVTKVIFSDNIVDDCHVGLYVADFKELIAHDNIIRESDYSGIFSNGTTDAIMRIHDNYVYHANTIEDVNHASIYIASGDDTSIYNNEIYGNNNATAERGIIVEGSPDRVTIKGNKIRNVAGRNIYANADHLEISDNEIYGASNTLAGIFFDTCLSVRIERNYLTGNFDSNAIENANNCTQVDINDNILYACSTGIDIQFGATDTPEGISISRNKVRESTGSTTDGEACIRLILNPTASVKNVSIDDNIITDNDATYYLGLSITGSADVDYSSVHHNLITGNKYGLGFNASGTWDRNNYSDNTIVNNSSYNVNEFSTVFTNRNIGDNIEA